VDVEMNQRWGCWLVAQLAMLQQLVFLNLGSCLVHVHA
jgi:hypothetical protein